MDKENLSTSESLLEAESIAHDILRPELFVILQQAASTQRYSNLGLSQESIQGQNVKIHTLRMMLMVNNLPISEEAKNDCVMTLTIHDLPETVELARLGRTSDTTSPQKALSSSLDKKVEKDEEKAAITIFTPDELTLYLAFSQAGDFLKNRNQNLPTTTGLISKILDKVDADLGYHKAAITSRANREEFSVKGQSLAFDQYLPFSQRLNLLQNTSLSSIGNLCQGLVNSTMLSIQEMWSKIPPSQIPETIKTCLDNFYLHS